MGTLYLIRHGQANFGGSDYDLLSPLGQEQSRRLGHYLAQAGLGFDKAYSGEKRRQQQTAAATLEAMGQPASYGVLSAFNEFDADAMLRAAIPQLTREDAALEAMLASAEKNYARFKDLMMRVLAHWVAGTLENAGELESWPAFLARIREGLQALLREEGDGRRIAVFTSGGPVSAALYLLAAGHYPAGLNWNVSNSSITELTYREGRLEQVRQAYATPHLSPDLVTYI